MSAALLVAAETLFLWMFLSADPIETARPSERALAFAADWRHGMAGNAWLYMPGFFATAAALWLHAGRARHVAALTVLAGIAAAIGAPIGARLAGADFEAATLIDLPATLPRFSLRSAIQGLYTLATWAVFVLACRRALVERTWRPFAAPAVLTVGLILIRPWTVDDFTTLWGARLGEGDPVAYVSAAAVVVLVALLTLSAQRSQSRSSPACAAGTRRAETTRTM